MAYMKMMIEWYEQVEPNKAPMARLHRKQITVENKFLSLPFWINIGKLEGKNEKASDTFAREQRERQRFANE